MHSNYNQRRKTKESILSETSFGIQSLNDENNSTSTNDGLFSLHTLAQTQQPDVLSFGRKVMCDSNADLVMPKIKNAKVIQQQVGRFRVIVCGDSGIGKTSVVEALTDQQQLNEIDSNLAISEVLDKDFCVVDTLGYGAYIHADTVISKVQAYIEKQFEQTNTLLNPSYHDEDKLLSLIDTVSTSLLTHVDICLYLTTGRLKNVDIEYMRNIHDLVNIVPVIVQPDSNNSIRSNEQQLIDKRIQVLKTLQTHDIHFLDFNMTIDELINKCHTNHHMDLPPFVLAWSSIRNTNNNNNNSNLLPSPSSSPPPMKILYLSNLKYSLFQNQQHVKYMRQQTTNKFMQWRQQDIQNISFSSNDSSSVSITSTKKTRIQKLHSVSEQRQMIEKEMIRREKKIRQELENARNEKTVELVIKEYQKYKMNNIIYIFLGFLSGLIISQCKHLFRS